MQLCVIPTMELVGVNQALMVEIVLIVLKGISHAADLRRLIIFTDLNSEE